jgi:catechol 2,3-dioxygenase-like lactoylglutathione lyase family enzyme
MPPVPRPGIHHVDLAVSDVERSLAFYLGVLGPLGLEEDGRDTSYRGTEEIVYLRFGDQLLGLRQADGGEHRYGDVGLHHLAFYVESRAAVDGAYERCLALDAHIHFPPEGDDHKYELFVFDPDGMRIEVGCQDGPRPA